MPKVHDDHKKGGKNNNNFVARNGKFESPGSKAISARDPNYDSEEDEPAEMVVSDFTKPAEKPQPKQQPRTPVAKDVPSLLTEYFFSGEKEELAASLDEVENLDPTNFIKKALIAGIERGPYERELVSQLLIFLYDKRVVSPTAISTGFEQAILAIDDIVLDNPGATEVLGKFVARAIVDEVIPPAFLGRIQRDRSAKTNEVVTLAEAMTTERHRADRLIHIWGPGDLSSVKRLKNEISMALQEYLVSRDEKEFEECIRRLNVQSFHFEIVKQAVYLAMAKGAKDTDLLLSLLSKMHSIGLLSNQSIASGFKICVDRLSDISLDVPNAKQLLDNITQTAKSQGWLSS